jgi:hypothetical protein
MNESKNHDEVIRSEQENEKEEVDKTNDTPKTNLEEDIEKNNGEYSVPVNKEGQILSESMALSIENEVRMLFRQLKFKEGTEKLGEAINTYNLENNEYLLEQLYYEGSLLISLPVLEENGATNVINAIKDTENLLISVLVGHPGARPNIILYNESLNPILDLEEVRIIEKTNETDKELLAKVKSDYPLVTNVEKIRFEVDNEQFYANIFVYEDGSAKLYKIDMVEHYDIKPYLTLREWKEFRELELKK